MSKNNRIKIAGAIKEMPRLVLDAPVFEKRVFETKIAAARRSGVEDALILQFSGKVAGNEEDFNKIQIGSLLSLVGEVCTENEREIVATAPTVKIFVTADKMELIEEIKEKKNIVKLRGKICKDPRVRTTPKGTHVADIMVAVSGKKGVNFIPCICWQNVADAVNDVKKGMYVEIEGRMQSREYKKNIENGLPYLMTAYEVSVIQLGVDFGEEAQPEGAEETA